MDFIGFLSDDFDSSKVHFTGAGNNITRWLLTASELLTANEILIDAFNDALEKSEGYGDGEIIPDEISKGFSVWNPRLMLCAFAMECYLKALWLKQGKELTKDGKYVGPKYHDLENLAKVLGITDKLSPDEIHVLRGLTWFGIKGRYPICLNSKREEELLRWRDQVDDENFESIINKIKNEMNHKMV